MARPKRFELRPLPSEGNGHVVSEVSLGFLFLTNRL